MIVLKSVFLVVCIFFVSYITGVFLVSVAPAYNSKKNLLYKVMLGFIGCMAAFQIISIPLIFLQMDFRFLYYLFAGCLLLIVVYSVFRNKEAILSDIKYLGANLKASNWYYIPAVIVILLQIFVLTAYMHIDDDDAFYVATATTTLETNTMYQYNSYTGELLDAFPYRYVLSPFPVLLAAVSKFSHIHPTIVAHTVFPIVFISLSYIVYYLFSKMLFKNKKLEQGICLFLLTMLNMYGYYSVYTSSTFLLIRIWQGKAVLAACILPAIFLFCMESWEAEFKFTWRLLIIGCLAASLCSSMGIILSVIMIGCVGIAGAIYYRNIRILIRCGLCCIPGFVLSTIYLFIKLKGI